MRVVVAIVVGVVVGGGLGGVMLYMGGGREKEKDAARFEEILGALKKVENRIALLEEEVADVEESLNALANQTGRLDMGAMRQIVEEALKKRTTPQTPPTPQPGQSPDDLTARIEKAVEKAIRRIQPKRPPGGKWTLAALADTLKIDARTADSIAQAVRDGKQKILNLLLTPRPDGTSILDEFVTDLAKSIREKGPEAAKQVLQRFFMRLMREKVPGDEATYFQKIVNIHQQVNADIQRLLGPKYPKYEALGIDDPTDKIKIPDDPLESYIQQALQQQLGGEPLR